MPIVRAREMLVGTPLQGWSGRFFHSQNMTFALWDISADAVPLHVHHHEQEEVWNVVEGRICLRIAGVEHELQTGDAAIVPPNVAHGARPLGACRVVVTDFPVRETLPGVSR